jgi:hypothetical protein
MFIRKATASSVMDIIQQLNSKKCPGLDGIRMKDIKSSSQSFSPVLAKLINLIFSTGVIPDLLKHSMIKPIFKSGDHKLFNNYRPIAILSAIEKVIERFVSDQLTTYLKDFDIIDRKQYGFQKSKSTSMLLADFSDLIFGALNKNLYVITLFIDFSKAFDTILHNKLLIALENIGICGPVLAFFKNYLLNRYMAVKFSDKLSNQRLSESGVPQGSILGPTLYLVYVNNMLKLMKDCNVFLYADDTVLVAIHKKFQTANSMLQNDFNSLLCWAHDNGLSINYKKTKVMTIQSPHNDGKKVSHIFYHDYSCLHRLSKTYNTLDCPCTKKIENVNMHTYLGVIIDNQFKWDKHIDSLCAKLRSGLYSIRILKNYVSPKVLKIVYSALLESHIRYGLLSWGRTTTSYIKGINNIENSFKNIIMPFGNVDNRLDLNFMSVQQLHFYLLILKHYFNADHKIRTKSLHVTRNIDKFILPGDMINSYGFQQRRYLIPFYFNMLPPELLQLEKYSEIKSKLKIWVYANIN